MLSRNRHRVTCEKGCKNGYKSSLKKHYRPIDELMILTGMILTEMAALRKEDFEGEDINLNKSYVGEEL